MDILELFKRQLTASKEQSSPTTIKNYLSDIRHFMAWFEALFKSPFDIRKVNAEILKLYEKSLGGRIENGYLIPGSQLSSASMKRHLSSLRKLFTVVESSEANISNPFKLITPEIDQNPTDYWHFRGFKDYLLSSKNSKMTIKNYLSDVAGFARWYEDVILPTLSQPLTATGGFYLLNSSILEDYKKRLFELQKAAPRTINRKLSSLRAFIKFASSKGFISEEELLQNATNVPLETSVNPQEVVSIHNVSFEETLPQSYSKIPPVRLLQKLAIFPYLTLEEKASNLIASIIAGKPVNGEYQLSQALEAELAQKTALRSKDTTLSAILGVKNVEKEFYAPDKVSLLGQPLYKKTLHHVRYSRPGWYKKYHNYTFVHYAHFALLVVFATGVGAALYQNLVVKKQTPSFAAPTAPPRILSFQGRLTDSSDNPITAPTNLRFAIYNNSTSSGSALLWQEAQYQITPDSEGVFSVLLGTNTSIGSTVFSDNSSLYLGVTIGSTTELSPRQRIASVGYSTNAEFLQGLPPITSLGAGDAKTNTILALNSSGNLIIDGNSNPAPIFEATGGQFTLRGNTLYLSTVTGTNSDIVLSPDGLGKINIQKPIINTTNNGDITPGGVEIHDRFAILATESAVAAFIVNNNTTGGDILSASSSGTTRFVIGNDGTLTASLYSGQNAALFGTYSTGVIAEATTAISGQCLLSGALNPAWATCPGGSNWALNPLTGAINPINNTVDFLLGGAATSSAKFALLGLNNARGSQIASLSGSLTLDAAATLGTTNSQSLTIGGSSTGNIFFKPGDTTAGLSLHTNGITGIGTSQPISQLHVTRPLSAGITGKSLAIFDQNEDQDIFTASSGGTTRFTIANNGNLTAPGIANANQANTLCYDSTTGAITYNAASGCTASSARYKHDINSIDASSSLEKVLSLRPVTYRYNSTYMNDQRLQLGFIAEEVNEVDPILIDFEQDGVTPNGVKYMQMSALLASAIQQQQLQIDSLKSLNMTLPPTGYTIGDGIINFEGLTKAVFRSMETINVSAKNIMAGTISATVGTFEDLSANVAKLGHLSSKTFSVDASTITIGGKDLREIIRETLDDVIVTIYNPPVLSPIASHSVKTDVISPLTDSSTPSLSFKDSRISIQNSQGEPTSWFDGQGNASFSGQLTSNSIQTNTATVSGTLATGTITTQTASVSGTLTTASIQTTSASVAGTLASNTITTNQFSTQTASISGGLAAGNISANQLSISENLTVNQIHSDFGIFEQGVVSMGPMTANILTATDQLSVGTNFSISQNAINTIGADLELQSFRQGKIAFQGGQIFMDTDGNMQVGGNVNILGEIDAVFGVFSNTVTSKALATSIISPLPGDDLTIKLTDDSASNSSKLRIANNQNQEVLSINNKGDIVSSGAATLSKLNFNLVGQAHATSLTEATASGSAGFATLRAGQPEITIKNPNVTSKSLIYITPFGDTKNKVLYLLRQTPQTDDEDGSFTIGLSGTTSPTNIQFNWLIVN